MRRLLLLSNSSIPSEPYFTWGRPFVKDFLGKNKKTVLFVPFAGVTFSFSDYTDLVKKVFNEMGHNLVGLHEFDDPIKAIRECEALAVGGGNTFQLFKILHEKGLMDVINERIDSGMPYLGWSAGSNTACPYLYTTNDMPIVQPSSFKGLGQLSFQLNVHYTQETIDGHGGESRDTRLAEYLVANPKVPLIGLRECSLIEVEGDKHYLKGRGNTMKLFRTGGEHIELPEGEFDPTSW
ncbi:MAG: dipeptidase PepE [Salibacteraceae bacterium]